MTNNTNEHEIKIPLTLNEGSLLLDALRHYSEDLDQAGEIREACRLEVKVEQAVNRLAKRVAKADKEPDS